MTDLLHIPLLAASETTTEKFQFDTPKTFEGWLAVFAVGGLLLAYFTWMYIRDTRRMSFVWTIWLLLLRLAVLVAVGVIFFNPHIRTQQTIYHPSQVGIMIDKSLSMRFPELNEDVTKGTPETKPRTRAEAATALMAESTLLADLKKRHQVRFYVFGQSLEDGPPQLDSELDTETVESRRKEREAAGEGDEPPKPPEPVNWAELLTPTDRETRLGESLRELIRQSRSRNLSGIVVITDGVSNAGLSLENVVQEAIDGKVRLFPVGVGSTQSQQNLFVSSIEAPTLVHTKDKFDISAYIQGEDLEGKSVTVTLKGQVESDEESPIEELERKTVELAEDGVPVKVTFEQKQDDPLRMRYFVEAQLVERLTELKEEDNTKDATVSISNKRTRVLLVAGGPMRDYRFLTNMLTRHAGIKVDAYLQSIDPVTFDSVSQTVDKLLTKFPTNMAELNGDPTDEKDESGYDVIVFFDPDWKTLVNEQPDTSDLITRWISEFSGGAVFVAGDVFTTDLASAGDSLKPIKDLYPVHLSAGTFFDVQLRSDANAQAWPVGLTQAGREAGFLQLTSNPAEALELWDSEFDGVYRCYPTAGAKNGATVYANFTDSQMLDENGRPILLASQIYGTGRTMYLGSGETWRLRSIDDEYHDRLWTKMIREVGQGRRSQGSSPVTLLPEKKTVALGETVVVRALVLETQEGDLRPSEADSVKLRLIDPDGEEIFPEPVLFRSQSRAGEFVGDFRATKTGRYKLMLAIPGVKDRYREDSIDVVAPGLEDNQPQQRVRLLTQLARDTGGAYVAIQEATAKLPELLTDKSDTEPIDQQIKTLWDRDWVLYAIVGLLSIEWLTRKLLKLA